MLEVLFFFYYLTEEVWRCKIMIQPVGVSKETWGEHHVWRHKNTHKRGSFTGLFPCLPQSYWGSLTPDQPRASTNSSNLSPESPLESWDGLKNPPATSCQSSSVISSHTREANMHTCAHIYTLLSVTAQCWGCYRHALTSQLNRERAGTARSSVTCTTHTHTQNTLNTESECSGRRILPHAKREVCISCRQLHNATWLGCENKFSGSTGQQPTLFCSSWVDFPPR